MSMCTHACVSVFVCPYVCELARVHVCMCVSMCMYVHTYVFMCEHVCMRPLSLLAAAFLSLRMLTDWLCCCSLVQLSLFIGVKFSELAECAICTHSLAFVPLGHFQAVFLEVAPSPFLK